MGERILTQAASFRSSSTWAICRPVSFDGAVIKTTIG
jgi:hypothetical protein